MVYSLWFKRILFDFIMGLRAALQFTFSPQQDVLAFFPIPLNKLSSDLMPPKKIQTCEWVDLVSQSSVPEMTIFVIFCDIINI